MASVAEGFDGIRAGIEKNTERAKSANAVFQFDIAGDGGGTWCVDVREATAGDFVTEGARDDRDVVIKMDAESFTGMLDGSVDAMQAFMMGKLKADNLGLATQLQKILG